jgi:DNA-directed RNA polymerase specialized sigma24 family protein
MDEADKKSVTRLIEEMKTGDDSAVEALWNRYFDQLVNLARQQLGGRFRRVADEEDVALSAFHSLVAGAERNRFHALSDRRSLWRLLVMITRGKIADQVQHQARQKRGGGQVRGESVFQPAGDSDDLGGIDQVAGTEPTPDFLVQMTEELDRRLDSLGDETLRQVALLALEGWTNEEIAGKINRSTRSVERKLEVIRRLWTEE